MADELKNKRVITCPIVGSWPTKKDNPAVPYTPKEIAESGLAAAEAGAAILHIHVREEDGSPSVREEYYAEVVERIKEQNNDVLINITSSSRNGGDDERLNPIAHLRPELASYDCGSLNWQNSQVFLNPPSFLEKAGKLYQECGVKPEIEVFDTGMVYNAIYYMKTGVLKAPCHFQFVLGAPGGMTNTIANLMHLVSVLPEGSTWAGAGIGAGHVPVMLATIALGGHLRVGLEDNVFYTKGVLAQSNAQLVGRAKRILDECGFAAATPDEARILLNLRAKDK